MTTRISPSGRKLALVALLAGTAGVAFAADTATQSATYEVQPINELSVSGNPGALVINTATAGFAPDQVSDATTTYAITTNETGKKITAAINTAMPDNVTLRVTLAAPTGATSVPAVTLGTTALDVVTDITEIAQSGKTITYTLDADVTAGVVESDSKTVTYTIAAAI